ncbi:MAG: FtsX-like permease family protein [Caldilineae bacterium]|nr:MAG: FtsX-like permease family protein [Caldilineae bacterium]
MQLTESLIIALRSLAANKLRSILTMLGIIIGVGAVIALISVGQGFEQYINEQFASLGTNLLFVVPGQLDGGQSRSARRLQPLTMADAEALRDPFRVPDVVAVAPLYSRNGLAVYGKRDTFTSIDGVTPEYETVRNFRVLEGEFITHSDVTGRSRVALLGARVVERLFPDEPPIAIVGQVVKINDVPFRVKGILEEKGSSGGPGGDEDNVILIPISTAQSRLFSARVVRGSYAVDVIFTQVVSEDRMDVAADEITDVLRERHRISFKDDDDFTVINQADLIAVFGDITAIFTIVLGSIAGISLVVGGIGIMNIMLVSVTERTREIGLRKAIGAKRSDILAQFLIESIVISVIGGGIGILLGILGSLLIGNLADLRTVVTPGAVLLATGFSIAVGLFFGIYPATRAARLSPIDALRYE